MALGTRLIHGEQWREFMRWHDGVLAAMAKAAARPENRAKNYYFIGENVEALNDRVRVELNPVLWEKIIGIPHTGEQLKVPSNLHMIFTMHRDNELKGRRLREPPAGPYRRRDKPRGSFKVSDAFVRNRTFERVRLRTARPLRKV